MMEIALVALALGLALAGTAWQMKGHVPWWSYLLTAGAWLALAINKVFHDDAVWALVEGFLAGGLAVIACWKKESDLRADVERMSNGSQ